VTGCRGDNLHANMAMSCVSASYIVNCNNLSDVLEHSIHQGSISEAMGLFWQEHFQNGA